MELVSDNAEYGAVEGEPPEQRGAWTRRGVGPADGGLGSVCFGWTPYLFLCVLCTLFWLATVLATSIRYRGWHEGKRTVGPGHASGDAYRESHDIRDPVSLVR